MNIFKKIILFIKNKFKNQETTKQIEPPKEIEDKEKQAEFKNSLKVSTEKKKKKKSKVETLICKGDGLGIQNGMKS